MRPKPKVPSGEVVCSLPEIVVNQSVEPLVAKLPFTCSWLGVSYPQASRYTVVR